MNTRTLVLLASLTLGASALAADPKKPVRSPGKPRAAVAVTTDLVGTVEGGTERTIRVGAQPQTACDELITAVHGTRGAEVRDGESRSHGAVQPGTRVEHPVRARIAAGASGHVVVTTTCRTGNQRRQLVESFVIAAKGPSGELPQPKVVEMGELTTDSEGRPIRVMQSTPK